MGTSSAFLPVEVDTDDQISGVRRFDLEVATSDFSIRRSRRTSTLRLQNLEPSILIAVDNHPTVLSKNQLTIQYTGENVVVREGGTTEFEIMLNSRMIPLC